MLIVELQTKGENQVTMTLPSGETVAVRLLALRRTRPDGSADIKVGVEAPESIRIRRGRWSDGREGGVS